MHIINQVQPQENITVSVQSFSDLFENSALPLAIDTYQRPYVWSADKVKQLIADLVEYTAKADNPLDYYMGAVLLHENREKQKLYIIDGQQRLTSLSVLHHVLAARLPTHCELSYRNPKSAKNIKQAQACFLARSDDLQSHAAWLFGRICFTVIIVLSEDLAFTFFDTQNNRGVPLNATDLLKAYHLREIRGDASDREHLQTSCAKRWERLQGTEPILGHGADFAPTLFHQFLWRARRWVGQKNIGRESYDDIIEEFQVKTIPTPEADEVPLYPTRSNTFGSTLTLLPRGGYRLTPRPLHMTSDPADLPFAIRQPITRGIGFFLYADKYTAVVKQLLDKTQADPEVRAFYRLYQDVILYNSLYLRELFLLASVMYVDQFGTLQLLRFALWLDHALGAIRIAKHYVFAQAPIIFLRDEPHNLLDVIASAYCPDNAINYLKDLLSLNTIYDTENIEVGTRVQGRYKQQLLTYYGRTDSLKGKSEWISTQFIKERLL